VKGVEIPSLMISHGMMGSGVLLGTISTHDPDIPVYGDVPEFGVLRGVKGPCPIYSDVQSMTSKMTRIPHIDVKERTFCPS